MRLAARVLAMLRWRAAEPRGERVPEVVLSEIRAYLHGRHRGAERGERRSGAEGESEDDGGELHCDSDCGGGA